MKQQFFAAVIYSVFLFFAMACRTEVPYDISDFEKIPVLNALFEDGKSVEVHLSFSGKMGNDTLTSINQAVVLMLCNGIMVDTLVHSQDGMYVSDSVVSAGNTYKLLAIVDGYDTLRATQTIPFPCKIVKAEFIPLVRKNEDGHLAGFRITIATQPGKIGYFRFYIAARDYRYVGDSLELGYFPINAHGSENDPAFIAEGLPCNVVSNAGVVNDSTFTVQLDFQQGRYYNTYRLYSIYCLTMTKEFYEYERSSYIYNESRYPEFSFGGVPPYNLYSNVEGGYGAFLSFSSHNTDTIPVSNHMSSFAPF